MSQKRRVSKSKIPYTSTLLDNSFDNSNTNPYHTILEIVKRVKHSRQIENITGTRGMSIYSIPEDIFIPEALVEYLEDYYQNN